MRILFHTKNIISANAQAVQIQVVMIVSGMAGTDRKKHISKGVIIQNEKGSENNGKSLHHNG
jgi:hypothetical protein